MDYLLSPEDEDLRQLKWYMHTAGYAVKKRKGSSRYMHRIVLERKIGRPLGKGELTDHINRDKLDNRRENLRVADKSLNTINRGIRPDNKSGYVGVYFYWPKKARELGWAKKWRAEVYRNGKKKSLGWGFKSPEEAAKAREDYLNKETPL